MTKVNFIDTKTIPKITIENDGKTTVLVDFQSNLTYKPSHQYILEMLPTLAQALQHNHPQSKPINENILTDIDLIVIISSLVQYLLNTNGTEIQMLEVGTYSDHTADIVAKILKMFSVDNRLFCVGPMNSDTAQFSEDVIVPIPAYTSRPFYALQNHYFDCVFLLNHLNDPDPSDFLINAIKKLKPGGLLLGVNHPSPDEDTIESSYQTLFGGPPQKLLKHSSVWTKLVTSEERRHILASHAPNSECTTLTRLYEYGMAIETDLKTLPFVSQEQDNMASYSLWHRIGLTISEAETSISQIHFLSRDTKLKIIGFKELFAEYMIYIRRNEFADAVPILKQMNTLLKEWLFDLKNQQADCLHF